MRPSAACKCKECNVMEARAIAEAHGGFLGHCEMQRFGGRLQVYVGALLFVLFYCMLFLFSAVPEVGFKWVCHEKAPQIRFLL